MRFVPDVIRPCFLWNSEFTDMHFDNSSPTELKTVHRQLLSSTKFVLSIIIATSRHVSFARTSYVKSDSGLFTLRYRRFNQYALQTG